MEKFDWLQQWPGLRDLLAQYGFTLPEGLAGQADFIRWLREQQAALAQQAALGQQDPRLKNWPELIDRLDEMGILAATDSWLIETASKDDRKPPLRLDPRLHTPAADIVRGAFGAGAFAQPVASGNALAAWQRLRAVQQGRPLYASFSPTTGLARSLASPSFVTGPAQSEGAKAERAHWFISNYGGLLHGDIENDANKTMPWRQTGAIGAVVYYQQLAGAGIPVYGATAAFSFDDNGELRFIQNGWYPVASDKLLTWQGELNWDAAVKRAVRFLQENGALPKGHEVKTVFGSGSEEGRVFLPTFDKGTEHAGDNRYLPAWSVMVVDYAGGNAWEVLVDAATGRIFDPEWQGDPRPEKLQLPLMAVTTANVRAYEDNAAALAVKPQLTAWSAAGGAAGSAPLGWSSGTVSLTVTGDFPGTGAPPDTPVSPTLEQLRAGHVFYHLCQAAAEFGVIRAAAWPEIGASLPPLPGSDLPLTVQISTAKDTQYLPDTGAGSDPSGVLYLIPGSQGADIDDQTFDCEVLYHEYAHAVLHQVRRQIVESAGVASWMQTNFRPAVNEGLAFYFAAALADRLSPGSFAGKRWGEYAYAADAQWEVEESWFLEHTASNKQVAGRDFLPDPESFPATNPSGPATASHLCGMVLARALWGVRSILGPETDAAVLRAVSMLGGIPDGLLAPAEAFQQRVRELHPNAYEKALRLLWSGRGIVADAPVNALLQLNLGAHPYTFAAAARGSCNSGCFYVTTGDTAWHALGTGGPHEMVALAAVDVVHPLDGSSRTLLFAAGDRWSPSAEGVITSGKLYSYVLDPAVFDATGNWRALAAELGDVSVLALAALSTGAATFSLIAATTGGLYRIEGSWSAGGVTVTAPWTALTTDPVLDVAALVDKPAGWELAVASEDGGYACAPAAAAIGTKSTGYASWALCVAAADQQVWIGTRTGVRRFAFDAGSNQWKWSSLGSPLPPVLCLLPGAELLAGTSRGLFKWSGGAWTPILPGRLGPVICLGRDPVGQVLAATAGRGLQRLDAALAAASRFDAGLPRANGVLDIDVPAGGSFSSTLAVPNMLAGGIATYVLFAPDAARPNLRLRPPAGVSLEVYFSAPHIDLAAGLWAGLEAHPPSGPDIGGYLTVSGVRAGYYLIVLHANLAVPDGVLGVRLE